GILFLLRKKIYQENPMNNYVAQPFWKQAFLLLNFFTGMAFAATKKSDITVSCLVDENPFTTPSTRQLEELKALVKLKTVIHPLLNSSKKLKQGCDQLKKNLVQSVIDFPDVTDLTLSVFEEPGFRVFCVPLDSEGLQFSTDEQALYLPYY